MARTLLLHIGHGKTGSSYLQSALALSQQVLSASSIAYPDSDAVRAAALGKITSGNGSLFRSCVTERNFNWPEAVDTVLFSSEMIFHWLYEADFKREFIQFLSDQRVEELRILLFIRDPISHACSSYQQAVKRGGNFGTLDDYVCRFPIPLCVNQVMDFIETIPGSSILVRNYSASRRALLPTMEAWLGVSSLSVPPVPVVNRSLTLAELELLRFLNQFAGSPARVLADRLCELLPDIKADQLYPSHEAQNTLWTTMADEITRVNSRIPASEAYKRERDFINGTQDDRFYFTREQLSVIAQSIAKPYSERGTRV